MAIDLMPNLVLILREEISKGITGDRINCIYKSKFVRRFDNFPDAIVLAQCKAYTQFQTVKARHLWESSAQEFCQSSPSHSSDSHIELMTIISGARSQTMTTRIARFTKLP